MITCLYLVKEPLLCRPGVRMLILAPVELPAGVGTQLVEAAIERVVEDERACALSVLQLNQMPLQHVALLVPQLGVEQLAEVGQPASIAAADIGLEVERIACEARVCPMQLTPYDSRGEDIGYLHPDCLKCGKCTLACPTKIMTLISNR